jgi:hypothetical protein
MFPNGSMKLCQTESLASARDMCDDVSLALARDEKESVESLALARDLCVR